MAIIGLDRLQRKLTQTIPANVEKATTAAMEQGAQEMVAMMQRLAPFKSGELRDSIGWTWGDPPEGAMVLGRSKEVGGPGRKQITIYAGNTQTLVGSRKQFQLARLQEFGTKEMAASPFFFPSYRALRKRVRGRITRSMKKAIQDGAK
jgi:HK97 gp10 family phage protein